MRVVEATEILDGEAVDSDVEVVQAQADAAPVAPVAPATPADDDFWDRVRAYARSVKFLTADEARAKAASDGLELLTSKTLSGYKHVRNSDKRLQGAQNFPFAVKTDLQDEDGKNVKFGCCFVSAEATALAIAYYFHLRNGGAALAAPEQ